MYVLMHVCAKEAGTLPAQLRQLAMHIRSQFCELGINDNLIVMRSNFISICITALQAAFKYTMSPCILTCCRGCNVLA